MRRALSDLDLRACYADFLNSKARQRTHYTVTFPLYEMQRLHASTTLSVLPVTSMSSYVSVHRA